MFIKRYLLFLFIPFLLVYTAQAITSRYEWTQQLGTSEFERGDAIVIDSSGTSYVTGYTELGLDGNSHIGSDDIFILKYSSSGIKQWSKQIGTTGSDYGNGIAADTSGNIYVVGATSGTLDSDPHTGLHDIFLAKYDPSGAKQWIKQTGTVYDDVASGIAMDTSGNIYVTGYTFGDFDGNTSSGSADAFLIKYNASGTKQWTRQLGTTGEDVGFGIAVNASGDIYITGYTQGALPGNAFTGGVDIYIAKYNASGALQWTDQFGDANIDVAAGIACDTAGNIYISGYTQGALDGNQNLGSNDCFITKYTSAGSRIWTKQFGTTAGDSASGITVDASNYLYIAGWTYGAFEGYTTVGWESIFTVKYSSDGTYIGAIQLDSGGIDWGRAVAVDNRGIGYFCTTGGTYGELNGTSHNDRCDVFVFRRPLDITPPNAAANLTATALNGAVIRLDWLKSTSSDAALYNIYYTSAQYSIDYTIAAASVTHPTETWTTPTLTPGITYKFTVRAEDTAGNEEQNTIVVYATAFEDYNYVKAAIKNPHAGKKISGNNVTVKADIVYGSISDVQHVRFEYKLSTASVWQSMIARNQNHPNPDDSSPYFIQWDISSFFEGYYDLRAVAADNAGHEDPSPAYITVITDHSNPDILEKKTNSVTETSIIIDTLRNNILEIAEEDKNSFTILTIPAGTISNPETTVIVTGVTTQGEYQSFVSQSIFGLDTEVPSAGTGQDIVSAGEYREIEFSTGETQLLQEITVTIPYSNNDSEQYLTILYYDETAGTWTTDFQTAIDKDNNTATFDVDHLTIFGLFIDPPDTADTIRAYPNPYKPSQGHSWIRFDNLPTGSAIKVYEISGEEVFNTPGITTGEYTWTPVANASGNTLGSGIYIYTILDNTEAVISTGKIAILR